jgi:hypothetical protein
MMDKATEERIMDDVKRAIQTAADAKIAKVTRIKLQAFVDKC